jgi:putative phosphoribosyl transferase
MDAILVRKLGLPFQPELAMGALGEGGVIVRNDDIITEAAVSPDEFELVTERETAELARRAERYRPGVAPADLHGRTALIVDDGIATGATAKAACRVARARGAQKVVLAAPVGVEDTIRELAADADDIVVLSICAPTHFYGVGAHYDDFRPTQDSEVASLIASLPPEGLPIAAGHTVAVDRVFDVGGQTLEGSLTMPVGRGGLVIFAHGSGSSRHSPRNRFVARRLNDAGFGTLLVDLLTAPEELDRRLVFDIDLLAARLSSITAQVRDGAGWIGYFGASTGAAAALAAAAAPDADIRAVVSRGGRPDLALHVLPLVRARTLLIVGGEDTAVLELNHEAMRQLRCEHRLELVPGATHLFEEPGTLDRVADLACGWFAESDALEPDVPEDASGLSSPVRGATHF